MPLKKRLAHFGRTIEHHSDIIVPGRPGVLKVAANELFVLWRYFIAQHVQRLPQWAAPLLVPVRVTAGVAPAVLFPAANAMGAAPGSVLVYFNLVRGRKVSQVLAVVRKFGKTVLFDVVKRIR